MNEILKLVICVAVVIRSKARENRPWSLVGLWEEIFGGDAWKLTIPAALYTVPSSPNMILTCKASKQLTICCCIKS